MEKQGCKKGLAAGVPIALGYLSVSFAFGMMAVSQGLPVWFAVLISMTNLTSAGQFAGLSLLVGGAGIVEMALTQFTINLRYFLMSLSLTQKIERKTALPSRLLMSFSVTDEIFAVASSCAGTVSRRFFYGLSILPYFGWALGTLLGAAAGNILPSSVSAALGIAIYAMFIAIIVPVARKSKAVLTVAAIAAGLGCLFRFVPVLNDISSGFVIIICAVVASSVGALLFPVKTEETEATE